MKNNIVNIFYILALLTLCSSLSFAAPRFLVTDFEVAPHNVYSRDENRQRNDWQEYHQTIKRKNGWWFASENVTYNENIGVSVRAVLSKDLSCAFDVVSQDELEVSLSKKRDAIAKQLNLDGADLTRAMAKISPVRLGRELEADQVVSGKFCSVATYANRFWGGVRSPLKFCIKAYDTRTGQCWFEKYYEVSGWGHSQYGSFKRISPTIVQDISLAWQYRTMPKGKTCLR